MLSDHHLPKESHTFTLKVAARIAVASLLASTTVVIGTASPAFASKPSDMFAVPNPGGFAGESGPLAQMNDLARDQFLNQMLRIVSAPPKATPATKAAPTPKKRK